MNTIFTNLSISEVGIFFRAWHENAFALADLQRLMAKWLTKRLGIKINIGCYFDHSSSLHIYGLYEGEGELISKSYQRVKKSKLRDLVFTTEEFMGDINDIRMYRRIIAARLDAMKAGHGTKLPDVRLKELGYDLENYPYPEEWDE